MSHITLLLLLPIISCTLLIMALSTVARRVGLVDKPDGRKKHTGEIPVVGGVSIFLAIFSSAVLLSLGVQALLPIMIGSMLVLVGGLDDRFGLSAYLRLPLQAGAALLMVQVAGISIGSVGSVFGGGDVLLVGFFATAFTVMCAVGVINSINMIDGVDGLSGVIAGLTFLPLIFFSWLAEDCESLSVLVICLTAILVFLYFNSRIFRKSALVFLGDAGSMFLGFLIVWFLVKLSQGADAVLSPISAGWIFGLPLVDTMSVMVNRVMERRSPFDADRNHLHHKLLDAGFSVNQTVLFMGLVHTVFILVGVISNSVRALEPVFFWSFVGIVLIYFLKSRSLMSLARRFNEGSIFTAGRS